jgi:hypothetical protein
MLTLRIVVVHPPSGVAWAVQGKPGELLQRARSTGKNLMFETEVRVAGPGPRLLGRAIQGPPAARFIYLCSGTLAGDARSCWTRRAKVPLEGITGARIAAGRPLEARIEGTAKDGGPACGSVPLLGLGWEAT